MLLQHKTLEKLNISGCCLGTKTGMGIADVISRGHIKISSLDLDISNNNLGPIGMLLL